MQLKSVLDDNLAFAAMQIRNNNSRSARLLLCSSNGPGQDEQNNRLWSRISGLLQFLGNSYPFCHHLLMSTQPQSGDTWKDSALDE